jgi:hypothetical protein
MNTFVGRDRELTILRTALEQAIQGDGSLALVSGPAGIGKTSLARQLVLSAKEQGALVLPGGCYDLSASPPYGPWLELTDRYHPDEKLPVLPEVLMRGAGVGDLQSQTALFDAVREFLLSVAHALPLLIVLEDLQWADQASLDLLRYLGRSLDTERILLVATYRSEEITPQHPLFALLPPLIRETNAIRIELSAFNREAVQQLVVERWDLRSADQDRLVDYLLTHAEGHPFFTVEVLRTLELNGFIQRLTDGWHVADLSHVPVPTLIRQVIEGRVSHLEKEARRYLEVAAVIGQQVQLDLWQELTAVSDEELLALLDQSSDLHLLETSQTSHSVSFAHALIREVLYTGIVAPRRRIWHRRVAEALLSSENPDPNAVADHFHRAADERAIYWLIRAGEQAQLTYAWASAADRFKMADTHLSGDPARTRERGWLMHRLGRAIRHSNPSMGVTYLEDARQIAGHIEDSVLDAFALAELGLLRGFSGDMRRGITDMAAGIDAIEALPIEVAELPHPSAGYVHTGETKTEFFRHRANSLRGTLALWLQNVGKYRHAKSVAQAQIEIASAGNADESANETVMTGTADAYAALGCSLAARGSADDAEELLSRTLKVHREHSHHVMVAATLIDYLTLITVPFRATRLGERKRLAAEIQRSLQQSQGAFDQQILPAVANLPEYFMTGQWSEALRIEEQRATQSGNNAFSNYFDQHWMTAIVG